MSADDLRFRFRVLGSFAVERDGVALPPQALGSRKGRLLLKLLILGRGSVVGVDRLVEVLWGDRPPSKVEDNLATLVSRLRSVIGAGAVVGGRGGYAFVPSAIRLVDLDEAREFVTEAEARVGSAPALAAAAAQAALDLLGEGRVLADEPYADWAAAAAADAQRLLYRARRVGWRAAIALHEPARALRLAAEAMEADPFDEDAHRAAMIAHVRTGERARALATYEALRTVLADELGTDPSAETSELHLAILRGERPELSLDDERAGRGNDIELVGRAHELERLQSAWRGAASGQGGLVLVTGEAGIGKTSVAGEFGAHARRTGGHVLSARCYEAERSLFLQPVADAIAHWTAGAADEVVTTMNEEHARALVELVPDLSRVVSAPSRAPTHPEAARRQTFEAVVAFLRTVSATRPVLLMLDDLHQAGDSTVELLHFAARQLRGEHVLLLATVRDEEGTETIDRLADMAVLVDIGPLDQEAVRELATRSGFADLGDALVERTRGHTLFVVEALRAAGDHQAAPDGIEIPDTLRAAVGQRVRRTGGSVEEMLRAASVVGSVVDPGVVARLLDVDSLEVARLAERALKARLLVEAGTSYEFVNDLVREILYESIPTPTLVLRHRRAAELFHDNPEVLARHASAAGEPKIAAEAYMQAAVHAAMTFSLKEALALLDEALEAAARAGAREIAVRARLERGRIREAIGDYEGSISDLSLTLESARDGGDNELEARALESLAWATHRSRRVAEGHLLAEVAAEAKGAGPGAFVLKAMVRHARGDLEEATRVLEELLARENLDELTRAAALARLGAVLGHADRYPVALQVLDTAIDACRRMGDFRALLASMWSAAMVRINLGDIAGGQTALELLERASREADSDLYQPRVLNGRAHLSRELGQLARARDLLEAAYELSSGRAQREPHAHALLGLAECAIVEGNEGTGEELLTEVASLPHDEVAYAWRLDLRARELRCRIDPAGAEELVVLAAQYGSPKYEALGLWYLGRAQSAYEVATRTGSDWLVGKVGPEPEAERAVHRMAESLPRDFRDAFYARWRR